jgi:nickel-dependent lactate racemase
MVYRNVTLPYGQESIEIRIPEGNLVGVYSPRDAAPVTEVKAEIRRALAAPIGALPLREQVRGKKSVVLIADDNTRLTPTDQVIPILLDECPIRPLP